MCARLDRISPRCRRIWHVCTRTSPLRRNFPTLLLVVKLQLTEVLWLGEWDEEWCPVHPSFACASGVVRAMREEAEKKFECNRQCCRPLHSGLRSWMPCHVKRVAEPSAPLSSFSRKS